MKIKDLKELLDAEVFCCEENLERQIDSACGCDLMSDVLAYVKDQGALLTGLVNPQVVRTAVIFFYLSNEGISLLENAAYLGLPIPKKLKSILKQIHNRAEKEDNNESE